MRPKEPADLHFTFASTSLTDPAFLIADLLGEDYRHLLFASEEGLRDLASSTASAMDGTFKVVKRPFAQLLTIHSLVEADGHVRQCPSAFVVMSRRIRGDVPPHSW